MMEFLPCHNRGCSLVDITTNDLEEM